MCDKNTTSGNPIALLQNVATANSQQERQNALKAVNQYVLGHSLEEVCSLAQKLPHILAQYQMDALDAYILSEDCPQELRVARDDLRQLLTPVFPALLVSGEALKIREKVDELESLSDYLESRVELREAILDLPPAEGEAVSGRLHHRLETLLLEEGVPRVLSTGNPPAGLASQFALWLDVSACEDLGMEHLALYFLAPAREGIRVWMPCCFTSKDGAREACAAAWVIAQLSPQLSRRERLELFYQLCQWTERTVLARARVVCQTPDMAMLQALYLLLRAAYVMGYCCYWNAPIFQELAEYGREHLHPVKTKEGN